MPSPTTETSMSVHLLPLGCVATIDPHISILCRAGEWRLGPISSFVDRRLLYEEPVAMLDTAALVEERGPKHDAFTSPD